MTLARRAALFLSLLPAWGEPLKSLGPFGGPAAVIETDPTRAGVVVAATRTAALFRSRDGGGSWTRLPFAGERRSVLHTLVIQPESGDYLIGLGSDSPAFSGIFQSSDEGRTWRHVDSLGSKEVWALGIWRPNPNLIAAGTSDGVFLSRDGGLHWLRYSPESNRALQPVVSVMFDPFDSRTLLAGTPHLIWRTVTDGLAWQQVRTGMMDDSDVFSIEGDSSRPGRFWASACSGAYGSLDGGVTWKRLLLPGTSRTYYIRRHPEMPDVLFAGTRSGLLKSVDSGATWRTLSPHPTRWIALDSNKRDRIFAATDAGLFRSDDLGETLEAANSGFSNWNVVSMSAADGVTYALLSSDSETSPLYRCDRSTRWTRVVIPSQVLGHRQLFRIAAAGPREIYALTETALLHSSDAGRTWTSIQLPLPHAKLVDFAALRSGALALATEDAVYYASAGLKWRRLRAPAATGRVRTLMILEAASVAVLTHSTVLVSSGGSDLRAIAHPSPGASVLAMAASGDALLAGTSRGLLRSQDRGLSWHPAVGVLGTSTVSNLCVDPENPGVLFASRFNEVYLSTDGGVSWNKADLDDDPGVVKEVLVQTGAEPRLMMGTLNGNVISASLDSLLKRGSGPGARLASPRFPNP
jgi:photosystem II stability/assembly factor-like uncharacterized protein